MIAFVKCSSRIANADHSGSGVRFIGAAKGAYAIKNERGAYAKENVKVRVRVRVRVRQRVMVLMRFKTKTLCRKIYKKQTGQPRVQADNILSYLRIFFFIVPKHLSNNIF